MKHRPIVNVSGRRYVCINGTKYIDGWVCGACSRGELPVSPKVGDRCPHCDADVINEQDTEANMARYDEWERIQERKAQAND